MHPKQFNKLLLYITLCASLISCTAGPELENYTRREIDRPYTLPKGVVTWSIPTFASYKKDAKDSEYDKPIPIPIIWEKSLSDEWDMLIILLPMGLKRQFEKNEKYRLGATVTWPFGYSSFSGFIINPSLELQYLRYINNDLAWSYSWGANYQHRSSSDRYYWSTRISTGPLIQLSDYTSISPKLYFRYIKSNYNFSSFDDVFDDGDGVVTTDSKGIAVTPAISFKWNFSRQWEFYTNYSYSRIGFTNDYEAHWFNITFIHLW